MRIISGAARGRRLIPPQGERVRPTSDRVKEALFSILTTRLGNFSGVRVLDLFAGSGALGIEALSRGADSAVFVDNHRESATLVRKNLELAGFAQKGRVICRDVPLALRQLTDDGCLFNLILLDPPYRKGLAAQTMELPAIAELMGSDSLVVAETACNEDIPETIGRLQVLDRRNYGDTTLIILALSCME